MFNEHTTYNTFYHVYNRGVDRRSTFQDTEDYQRFLEGMRIFNTPKDASENISFARRCQRHYSSEDQLVRFQSFSIMPNHYHLLPLQVQKDGLPFFMQRAANSYTKYFNRKEGRSGCLFESGYKSKLVTSESYLLHLTRYFHLNLLSLIGIDWKHQEIKDKKVAKRFLVNYKWSSFYYYFNQIESPILDLTLLKTFFNSPMDHLDFMFQYEPSPQINESEVDFF